MTTELSILEELRSPNWQERQKALRNLRGTPTDDAILDAIRQAAEDDGDSDVRGTAIRTAAINVEDPAEALQILDAALSGAAPTTVRLGAVLALHERPDLLAAHGTRDSVWRLLVHESSIPVQAAAASALVAADRDDALKRAEPLVRSADVLETFRAGIFVQQAAGREIAELDSALAGGASRMPSPFSAFQIDVQRASWTLLNQEATLDVYLHDASISDIRATLLLLTAEQEGVPVFERAEIAQVFIRRLSGALRSWLPAGFELPPPGSSTAPDMFGLQFSSEEEDEALRLVRWTTMEPPSWPDAAVEWFDKNRHRIPPALKEEVVGVLWEVLPRAAISINPLLGYQSIEDFFGELALRGDAVDRSAIGRALLAAEKGPHLAELREHVSDTVDYIAQTLSDPDRDVRRDAADWISKRASYFKEEHVEELTAALEQLQNYDTDPDVNSTAREALIELTAQRRRVSTFPLVTRLRGADEEAALDALKALDELSAADAPRAMVSEWVTWLALRSRATLVESAAERLRTKASSVLPILDQMVAPLELSPPLEEQIRAEFTPIEIAAVVTTAASGGQVSDSDRLRLQRWLGSIDAGSAQSAAVVLGDEIDTEELNSCIIREIEARRRVRQVEVRRRLSRQLMEMSEERFFDHDSESFDAVSTQLRLHAVPMLSRRLQEEDDLEARENIARALGNIGGREAVEALARAIAGEERTRENRQELLARYYLEPSKLRSDEAARILETAVRDARNTLRVLQRLNFVFAAIGLTFLAAGLALLLLSDDAGLRLAGGAISVSAFLGLVVQVVREPLDRIQEAMNRLVQVETAFTSFIWELNLNGTFIQSQYVANGILSSTEITDTVDRIEGAMRLSMDLVATYAERGASRVCPSLTSISPGVIHEGDRVKVRGVWLSGASSTRRSRGAHVQLDHRPIAVQSLSWTDTEAEFRLAPRSTVAGGLKIGVHWLSLSINGRETNALPVQVVPRGETPLEASAGQREPAAQLKR